jgi:hypothetical protein
MKSLLGICPEKNCFLKKIHELHYHTWTFQSPTPDWGKSGLLAQTFNSNSIASPDILAPLLYGWSPSSVWFSYFPLLLSATCTLNSHPFLAASTHYLSHPILFPQGSSDQFLANGFPGRGHMRGRETIQTLEPGKLSFKHLPSWQQGDLEQALFPLTEPRRTNPSSLAGQ